MKMLLVILPFQQSSKYSVLQTFTVFIIYTHNFNLLGFQLMPLFVYDRR